LALSSLASGASRVGWSEWGRPIGPLTISDVVGHPPSSIRPATILMIVAETRGTRLGRDFAAPNRAPWTKATCRGAPTAKTRPGEYSRTRRVPRVVHRP